ncbi:hypothetical protein BG003_010814 [Podila horticola]|nr:hypothetical protein BG003_010814 [Podila horticola]
MSPLSHPYSKRENGGRRLSIHNSSAQPHYTSKKTNNLGSTHGLLASCHHGDISREKILSYFYVTEYPTKIRPKRSIWPRVLAATLFMFALKEILFGSYSRYSSLRLVDIGTIDGGKSVSETPSANSTTTYNKQIKSVVEKEFGPSSVHTDSRAFRKVEYQGLTLNSTTYQDHIEVYHVAKEFGPASMGGLGMVVTALAVAQQMAGLQTVNIVLPYYSFLDNTQGIDIEFHMTLSIDIRNDQDVQQPIRFNVYTFKYIETYEKGAVTPVTVWLIGPGDTHPFDLAFEVDDVRKIYFEPKVLPGEWKDLFFSKATAAFLRHRNTIRGAPHSKNSATIPIVVHLHGATNALVIHYLQQSTKNRLPVEKQPALVYTLHDYLDELLYSATTESLQKFMDSNIYSHDNAQDTDMQWESISTYNHDHRIFTSSLGIDLAHISTFVSKAMTKDIVEGRLDFYLKELVLDSILDQAEKNRFIGVTNGIDLSRLNPWMADLRRHQLDFPAIESARKGYTSSFALGGLQGQGSEQLYRGKQSGNPTIRSAKDAAKRHLYLRGFLTAQDLHKPLVLFIGRFQYNKGLEFFATASSAIRNGEGKLVIMGQPNSYPIESILELESRFNDTVRIISDAKAQREWGSYLRTAADFLFVPSLTESFGLVAAEGLLFGSTVISSGVGGLSEFLIDRGNVDVATKFKFEEEDQEMQRLRMKQCAVGALRKEQHNSYFFDAFALDAHSQLSGAIDDALQDWRILRSTPIEHEKFLTRLVARAISMAWDRPDGPVAEYRAIYEIALNSTCHSSDIS